MTEPLDLDATGQAELVRKGEVKPQELVEAAIARAEALDPQLNAVILPRYDEARGTAAGELPNGPFRGVPFLLKDLGANFAGWPNYNGMQALKDAGWTTPGWAGVRSSVDTAVSDAEGVAQIEHSYDVEWRVTTIATTACMLDVEMKVTWVEAKVTDAKALTLATRRYNWGNALC